MVNQYVEFAQAGPDEVRYRAEDPRLVSVEQSVTKLYEHPRVEERIRHVKKVIEVEKRVPVFSVVERNLVVESNAPRVVERQVEVPVVVKKPVKVSVPQIVEVPKVEEVNVHSTVVNVYEKVIEKPVVVTRTKEIVTTRENPVIGDLVDQEIPVVIARSSGRTIYREEGNLTIPINRYKPKFIPVNIPIKIPKKDVIEKLQKAIKLKVVQEFYEPLDSSVFSERNLREGVNMSCFDAHKDAKVLVEEKVSGNTNEIPFSVRLSIDEKEKKFTADKYNYWLLQLNKNLLNDIPSSILAKEADASQREALLRSVLPFVALEDGSIPVMEPGSEKLIKDISKLSLTDLRNITAVKRESALSEPKTSARLEVPRVPRSVPCSSE